MHFMGENGHIFTQYNTIGIKKQFTGWSFLVYVKCENDLSAFVKRNRTKFGVSKWSKCLFTLKSFARTLSINYNVYLNSKHRSRNSPPSEMMKEEGEKPTGQTIKMEMDL